MTIPKEVQSVIDKLEKKGFEAYIVGGCVRDFLRGVEPEDWDVTTSGRLGCNDKRQAKRNQQSLLQELSR